MTEHQHMQQRQHLGQAQQPGQHRPQRDQQLQSDQQPQPNRQPQRGQQLQPGEKSREQRANLLGAVGGLLGFVLWTLAIARIDVQPIGPRGSEVGFATVNGAFHQLTGVHWTLYNLTDWMGAIAVLMMVGFAVLGLCQLVWRRSLLRVDADLLVLGAFYVLLLGCYLAFEAIAANYRPVLVEGRLEASYPSSTTLLVLTVIPTAIMQLRSRIANRGARRTVVGLLVAFAAFMVAGRTLAGVHWLTDIVGGILLGFALVMLYRLAAAGVRRA